MVKAAANEVALLDIDGTPMRDAVPKSMALDTLLLPEGLDEPTAFGGGDHARRVRGAGHAARVLVVLVECATMPSASFIAERRRMPTAALASMMLSARRAASAIEFA